MENIPSYEHLSATELRAELDRAFATERTSTAIVIAVLIEVERRQLFLEDGYPSLYVYCTDFFHLAESEAHHKIQAVRAAIRWPQTWTAIRRGELTLTSLALLRPHLTDENCDALIAEARHQPTRAVQRIVARLAPRPDKPGTIRPTAPGKYDLRMTIDEETHDLILTARELFISLVPTGDLASLTKKAYKEMVERALRRKTGATDHPRAAKALMDGSRAIPAEVRREVWARDGGRCAFEGSRGRCPVSGAVDFHHVIPYAMGGPATADNIELRCRAHNVYQARKDGLDWQKGA